MPDLLVPLYGLPEVVPVPGVLVDRPLPHLSDTVVENIASSFSAQWAAESRPGLYSVPPTILTAACQETGEFLGFCCWDCTATFSKASTSRKATISRAILESLSSGAR